MGETTKPMLIARLIDFSVGRGAVAILMVVAALLLRPDAAAAAQAPEIAKSPYAEVVLLTDRNALAPGERFTLALKQKLAPRWHSYWRNPGAIGLPTTIEWTAPDGLEFGEILWPTPSRAKVGRYVNFGYEDEAILLVEARLSKDWPLGKAVSLTADAAWLVCEDRCYPESQKFSLTLPVAKSPQTDFRAALEVARGRAALPPDIGAAARYRVDGERLLLEIDAPHFARPGVEDLFFFPENSAVVEPSEPQIAAMRKEGASLSLPLKVSEKGPAAFEPPLRGVLAAWDRSGAKPVRLAIAVTASQSAAVTAPPGSDAGVGSEKAGAADPSAGDDAGAPRAVSAGREAGLGLGLSASVGAAALLAFLGGLILNLMPCVFPVLALKAMSLARAADQGGPQAQRDGLAHGLAYGAGVMASFLAFAAALLALRSAGVAAGWGFQLQNPAIVAVLAYLLIAVGLNFSGAFEVSGSFSGLGQSLTEKGGRVGDFFTGVLAALVAAPCTAPFMGAALGYAVTQSAGAALVVFAALGLGFAAPIVALSASPAAGRLLPRPGPWMVRFRRILAFPLYLAAAWLFWVLGNQVGGDALFAALVGAVLLAFALWMLGEGFPQSRPAKTAAAIAAALALFGSAYALSPSFNPPARTAAGAVGDGVALAYDEDRLAALRAENKTVFVNVTADWCISCKVNEAGVLSGERFESMLRRADAAYVKGDWTLRDEKVTDFLAQFGRIGVPLYVVYPRGGEPIVLPQILTEGLLEEALGLR